MAAVHPQGLTITGPRPTAYEVQAPYAETVWRTGVNAPDCVTLLCDRCNTAHRLAIYTVGQPHHTPGRPWWHHAARYCSIDCWASAAGHLHLHTTRPEEPAE